MRILRLAAGPPYFVLYPTSTVQPRKNQAEIRTGKNTISARWWFLYQLLEANFGLFGASANGGGVAFFAHVGGFLFGVLVARLLVGNGRVSAGPVRPRFAPREGFQN